MPRNPTTGDFSRVSNSFSEPIYGTVIDPTDANALFDDYDTGLTFNDASPLILIGSTSGVTKIQAADTASGTITLPAGTTDFSATGGAGQFVRQDSAGAPFTVTTIPASEIVSPAALTRTDDTNVTLTLGGAPATALLAATSITAGWTGTLAAGRLNANVVQAITNDTNVTGSIAAQNMTLGWSGQLSPTRGGTGSNLSATGGTGQVLKQSTVGGNITVGTIPASDIASPGALTRVSDTNVTLTLGGTPSTALLAATSLTVGWSGTLAASRGGFGADVSASSGVPLFTTGVAAFTSTSGTGNFARVNTPTFVTPVLGAATATTINGLTITTTTGAFTVTNGKTLSISNSMTLAGTDSTTMTFPAVSSNVLTTGNTATITKGYTVTPNNIGTVSSGTTTLDPVNGNYQYLSNNGSFTLAAPSSDCAIDLLVTNAGSAGSITFSGFTVGASTGSSLTTTNTNKFLISVRRINSISTYSIYALQ